MKREELLLNTRTLLIRAGFYCSDICRIRPVSFDFIARRDNTLIIIKVLNNIDALNEDVAEELISISHFLEGAPLVIGMKTCSLSLEDDVVYFRYDVPIITYFTLDNYLHGAPPLICAAPGGFYVNINGEILKKTRDKHDISVGQLARVAGVSRRTIRMYEEGERASVEVTEKMATFLGDDFIKPMTLFENLHQTEIDACHEINDELLSMIKEMCTVLLSTQRSPFHALSQIIHEKYLVCINERRIIEKARIIANLAKVTENESVIFMETYNKKNIEGVPVIVKKEICKIREPEQFIDLIDERK